MFVVINVDHVLALSVASKFANIIGLWLLMEAYPEFVIDGVEEFPRTSGQIDPAVELNWYWSESTVSVVPALAPKADCAIKLLLYDTIPFDEL
jgi:hypothetical protein